MMDFVSWDDDSIPSFWKVNPNSMVPNHQQPDDGDPRDPLGIQDLWIYHEKKQHQNSLAIYV
jgi:hypothetical protein